MSTDNNYKPSTLLRTVKASAVKSATFATSHETESMPMDERYWSTKFGLCNRKKNAQQNKVNRKNGPILLTFASQSAGSSIVSHICFELRKQAPYPVAIVSGPRVALYGGSIQSDFHRALSRHTHNIGGGNNAYRKQIQSEENDLFLSTLSPAQLKGMNRKLPSLKPDRSISTGGNPAHCAAYRPGDGRLMAVGCDGGIVKVCDTKSRATLRTFQTPSNTTTVRSVGWLPNGQKIWSAGDDARLTIWDLSSTSLSGNKPVVTFKGHGDAIRNVVLAQHVQEKKKHTIAITASYDHTIRVWDLTPFASVNNDNKNSKENAVGIESMEELSVMNHGAPVESLLLLPPTEDDKLLIVSAAATTMKLWNPLTGTCLANIPTKHSKTITSMCLASIIRNNILVKDETTGKEVETKVFHKRLITASLDGLIRIHSLDELYSPLSSSTNNNSNGSDIVSKHRSQKTQSYNIPFVHGVRTSKVITAIAMSPCNTRLIIGSTDGYITVRQRAKYIPPHASGKKKRDQSELIPVPKPGTYAYFMRGANINANVLAGNDDHVLIHEKKRRLTKFDKHLKEFSYVEALDEALNTKEPQSVMAVLEELGKRRGLLIALSNRDEETLEPILAFTSTFIARPRYTNTLIGVTHMLCDIYSHVIGQSETIDEYFKRLKKFVSDECRSQKTLLGIVGQIDAIMYAAELQESQMRMMENDE